MGTTPAVTPAASAAPSVSELTKIWNWIKGKVAVVESDVVAILGSKAAADLETVGKTMLDSWIGPLATSAIAEATDIATGKMSVSKAISGLVAAASSGGKTVSEAAALQVIAIVQNALPVNTANGTVTPAA